ncbi:MAG: C4-dicarboxylate ABC transporter substrate-binding protein [marine bacterium B5-7]|nr:MAG: C4-dicarboxylate ABC transporter substrate-binding protein [marine bacterium B5-7]
MQTSSNRSFCSRLATALLALSTLVVVSAQAQTVVPMLACPLGCGVVQTQTVLAARMARADSKILPAAQETPGYMYNVRVMAEENRWKKTVFGTEDIVMQAALQGGRPELAKYMPVEVPIRFKLLYGDGLVQQGKFFVTLDPSINSIADLKGKRISIGLPTQSDWGMSASLLLEYGFGITAENTDIRHVTPPVMTQELIDGNTDACLLALVTNSDGDIWWTGSLTSKIAASGKKMKYLGMSQEAIDTVNKEIGMSMVSVTVPKGTLPGQDEPFLAGSARAYQAVHPEFPEEVAYELVKSVVENGPELKESGQGFWKWWSKSNMVAGLSEENAHPGAIRAYKELGMWEARKNYPPVTYPEK